MAGLHQLMHATAAQVPHTHTDTDATRSLVLPATLLCPTFTGPGLEFAYALIEKGGKSEARCVQTQCIQALLQAPGFLLTSAGDARLKSFGRADRAAEASRPDGGADGEGSGDEAGGSAAWESPAGAGGDAPGATGTTGKPPGRRGRKPKAETMF